MDSGLKDSAGDLVLAVRSSVGLSLRQGTSEDGEKIFDEPTKAIGNPDGEGLNNKSQLLFSRVCAFNSDGAFLAYCDSVRTVVIETGRNMGREVFSKDLPRTHQLSFSPKSTYLLTWEPYYHGKDRSEGEPNVKVWNLQTGDCANAYVSKKQHGWEPQFSDDESICFKLMGSELLCHTDGNLTKYARKHVIPKMSDYSLSKGPAPFHVACYVPVAKGQPGLVRMLSCDNFGAVSSKTFWKADRVSMTWNNKGSAVIVMAITDIDSTGQSYYGEQNLYVLLTKGEGYMVALEKNGPVYQVDWSPSSAEFCVVYGYMPAKATLYNLKGDSVMDFGTGPRNEVHYNPFGNILCICGFGNLRGNMEFWSTKDKKKISQLKAEDTTFFQWAPDGQHFVTATTAPRLRVNNGYKFWKYTGEIVSETKFPPNRELWEVVWKPESPGTYSEFKIDFTDGKSPATGASQGDIALPGVNKDAVYVPPHMRNTKNKLTPSQPPGQKKGNGRGHGHGHGHGGHGAGASAAAGPSPKEKEILKLQKKLKEIEGLKVKRDGGAKLQPNQLEKIDKECELLGELSLLELSS